MFNFSFKTILGAIFSRYFSMVLTVLSFIILGKYYSTEDLGFYSLVFGICSSLCYWVGLGASEAIIKNANDKQTNQEWWISNSFAAHCFTLIIAFFICIFAFFLYSMDYIDILSFFITVWISAWGLSISMSHILIIFEKEKLGNLLFYGFPAMISFTAIFFCSFKIKDINFVITTISLSYISFSLIFSYLLLKKLWGRGINSNLVVANQLIFNGVLFSTSRVFQSFILWTPIWLTSYLFSLEATAMVSIVFRLGLGVSAFMSAIRLILRKVTLVKFSEDQNSREELYAQLSFLGTISSIICLFTIIPVLFIGDWVFITFFDIVDQNAKYLLMIVIFSLSIECFFSLQEDLMKNVLKLIHLVKVQIIILVILIILGWLLSTIIGVYAFVITFMLQVLLYQSYISLQSFRKFGLFVFPQLKKN